jgi:uncharacterized protein
MPRTTVVLAALLAAGAILPAHAQRTVQAVGTGTVTVNPPEQAQLTVGVTTQGNTADQAAQQNATISTAVQAAIQKLIGANGTMQTTNYSISPRYSNTSPATLVGYTATNSVLVTMYDISVVGKLIDATSAAGANSVSGITFGLRNPDPYVQQALGQASKQALAHVNAIATGLGAKTGAILAASEGVSYTPVYDRTGVAAGSAPTTPVQTSGVTVTATVTVSVQLVQ